MARIGELIEIKKDSFFNGAVQAEWFYNSNRRADVAKSYIFHGPKYYGVSQKDISSSNHKLCDTVTFTKAIYNKIYKETDSNRFVLTIAGYGAGKSHLTLALATLMSNINDKERCNESIAPVIILNGMLLLGLYSFCCCNSILH